MRGREGQDVAFPRHRLCAEEGAREVVGRRRRVLGLLFLDGAVVVDEDEGVFILGV